MVSGGDTQRVGKVYPELGARRSFAYGESVSQGPSTLGLWQSFPSKVEECQVVVLYCGKQSPGNSTRFTLYTPFLKETFVCVLHVLPVLTKRLL